MLDSLPDLGSREVQVAPKRKIVARLTNFKRELRVDLRYWSIYDKVDRYIPLKNQGIFMKLEDLRAILPSLKDICDTNL